MSNAKIISLIAAETRQVRAEDERARTALAADLYADVQVAVDKLTGLNAALEARVEALERDVQQLKAHSNLNHQLRRD